MALQHHEATARGWPPHRWFSAALMGVLHRREGGASLPTGAGEGFLGVTFSLCILCF